ncbi:Hypothetical protein POVR2_LOCUS125 [uncultured virus]|nr:Hypothetical protein POVR2_LOCUS125 [uncultured virus]
MNNPDTLRKLAISLDYQTLVDLGRESEWVREVTNLFKDWTFWKQKTEYVAGMTLPNVADADWVQIYHKVVDLMTKLSEGETSEDEGILSVIYEDALDDLATLQVFLAIHPVEKMKYDAMYYNSLKITSLPVLEWLFENGYLVESQANFRYLLRSAVKSDSVKIVKWLLNKSTYPEVKNSLKRAMDSGSYETFTYILGLQGHKRLETNDILELVVQYAPDITYLDTALDMYGSDLTIEQLVSLFMVSYNNEQQSASDVARILLQRLSALTDIYKYEDKFYALAVTRGNVNILRVLLEFYPEMYKNFSWNTLFAIVRDGVSGKLIPLLLEYVDPSVKNNELLYFAATRPYSLEQVVELLKDSRVDPNEALTRIFSLNTEIDVETIRNVAALANDERTNLNTLSKQTSKGVVDTLLDKDQREGYRLGSDLVVKSTQYLDVASDIVDTIAGPNSLYSRTVAMLIKIGDRPRVPLFDWMIAQGEPEFALAASNVLSGVKVTNWIEALMTVALHKSITVKQVVDEMRPVIREAGLLAAAKIVGLYLGLKQINTRDAQ